MELQRALSESDWDRVIVGVRGVSGMPLLEALREAPSRDVADGRPDGLWHLAELRHTTLMGDREARWPSLSEATFVDGATVRRAMQAVAKASTVTVRKHARTLSEAGFFVVCGDGSYASVLTDQTVVAESDGSSTELPLDLFDRVEDLAHPLRSDAVFRARVAGDGRRLVPAEPAIWQEPREPALDRCFPTTRDVVLVFASRALGAAEEGLREVSGTSAPHAAAVLRWHGSLLARTLYFGDFGGEAEARIDVLQLMYRRLWAPVRA